MIGDIYVDALNRWFLKPQRYKTHAVAVLLSLTIADFFGFYVFVLTLAKHPNTIFT